MTIFTGSGVAIVTPFKEATQEPDLERLAQLIEFQLENQTDAIIITGTTGEASTLNDEEHLAVVEQAVKVVNGRVPVIAGTGSNDTRHGINLSIGAEKVGADGLLQVTPYYNKTTQKGLKEHFLAIANSVNIPIILYSVPSRTNMPIAPETLVQLIEHPLIVGLKDATDDLAYTAEVRRLCGERLDIYSGNDDVVVPILSLGGKGVISVMANIIPFETHDMCAKYFAGDTAGAAALQIRYKELIVALFKEPNPIPVKTALRFMGLDTGVMRLPLTSPAATTEDFLREAMRRVGLL